VIFDVLWLDGASLMGQPYVQRRHTLATLGLAGAHWRVPDHVPGGGAALLAASAEQRLEGVIAKRLALATSPVVFRRLDKDQERGSAGGS